MANLITEKQKRTLKIGYLARLFSVSLFIPVSLLGIFLLAYVIPYYITVNKKDSETVSRFNSVLNAENKENVGQNETQIVSQTLGEMKVVELYSKDSLAPSDCFEKIIANKNFNIQITKLSFNQAQKGHGQFLVSGLAKNREGLVTFIDDLKSQAGFVSVDSPISNFAKDSDISFTLTLNIKTGV